VGKPFIAGVLQDPRYRLYDPKHNGGLWAGKDYAQAGLWRRDPLHDLSHGATAIQVARFYYLLETGNLVSPEASRKMKEILSKPGIEHKFVAGLASVAPEAQIFRKSGTWAQWHSDSAIVEHDGRKYIAVALAEDPAGGIWMREIIVALDHLILESKGMRVASSQRSGGS
jgi:beta-lactamase class A